MGTRGKLGFYYKGKYYICYNHFDSYPGCLGVRLLLEIINADLDVWVKLLENIKEVSDKVKPKQEDVEKLKKYTDLSVSEQSTEDWYCLLKFTQGSFHHVLHAGYMKNVEGIDMGEEYSYVLDLDNKVFRARGNGLKDVEINLNKEEMMKYVKQWSDGNVMDEKYDPEEKIAKEKNMKLELERMFGFSKGLRSFRTGY